MWVEMVASKLSLAASSACLLASSASCAIHSSAAAWHTRSLWPCADIRQLHSTTRLPYFSPSLCYCSCPSAAPRSAQAHSSSSLAHTAISVMQRVPAWPSYYSKARLVMVTWPAAPLCTHTTMHFTLWPDRETDLVYNKIFHSIDLNQTLNEHHKVSLRESVLFINKNGPMHWRNNICLFV